MESEDHMKSDIKWLDNPEIFRVNQMSAHSDHEYYLNYHDLEAGNHGYMQSLNGCWDFCCSINAKERPGKFYEEDFDGILSSYAYIKRNHHDIGRDLHKKFYCQPGGTVFEGIRCGHSCGL